MMHAAGGRRLSILLIIRSYPPVTGGSEVEAQQVCAALRARGHDVRVLCGGGPPMPAVSEWVDPFGTPVSIYGKDAGRNGDRAYAAGVVRTLWRDRNRYDVAYFLMPGLQVTVGVPVAGMLGKPIVMKFSGSNEILKLRDTPVGRVQLQSLQKWAHRILILNPGMAGEAATVGFRSDRVQWMPNPVDTAAFAPSDEREALRQELGIAPECVVVLFAGRLAPEKELGSLVGGFARAAHKHPAAVLTLVGDGPLRNELEARVRELGIEDRVRFTGMLPASGVRKWMQAADVFTLVSRLEGLPVSLIEAMATELPAVVSAIPANLQLVGDGVHGFSVPVGDEDAIARGLQRLMGDAGLRRQFGLAARQAVAERFSAPKVAADYEDLFYDVLRLS